MKRSLLAALCVMTLILAGCAAVNQTNTFAAPPPAGEDRAPLITAAPDATATPETTAAPETAQPPVVPLNVQPTPRDTDAPVSPAPPETPAETGGFNG